MKEIAVALRFLENVDSAPKVLATGEGNLALKIQELARKHGVEIVQDAMLANALHSIPQGKEIPEALYQVVAVLFRFLREKSGER